ncbi:translation protein SH3-like domain-containing protein [Powellomyces hirtus]|nr:translation protein SH3-like domain-containing protein [Powellomyces hirtus]
MPPKFKGANFMVPKRPKVAEKDRIQNWNIFVGDKVEIIRGRKDVEGKRRDVGKQGKVLEVLKDLNAVIVEGCNLRTKNIKPNPDNPKGNRILKELHIPYANVRLVDPATGQASRTRLVRPRPGRNYLNPVTGRHDFQRLNLNTKTLIPIPTPKDPFADKEIGPLDTSAEIVGKHTYQPDITTCPFPNAFMNELERMRRKNMESSAF